MQLAKLDLQLVAINLQLFGGILKRIGQSGGLHEVAPQFWIWVYSKLGDLQLMKLDLQLFAINLQLFGGILKSFGQSGGANFMYIKWSPQTGPDTMSNNQVARVQKNTLTRQARTELVDGGSH